MPGWPSFGPWLPARLEAGILLRWWNWQSSLLSFSGLPFCQATGIATQHSVHPKNTNQTRSAAHLLLTHCGGRGGACSLNRALWGSQLA